MKLNKLIMALSFVLMFFSLSVSAQNKNELKGKKVLFVWGGWEGHEPKPCRDLFVPWLESEGAEVISRDNLNSFQQTFLLFSGDLSHCPCLDNQIHLTHQFFICVAVKIISRDNLSSFRF